MWTSNFRDSIVICRLGHCSHKRLRLAMLGSWWMPDSIRTITKLKCSVWLKLLRLVFDIQHPGDRGWARYKDKEEYMHISSDRPEPNIFFPLASSQVVRVLDSLADVDLTNGVQPGKSEMFNVANTAEIRLFQRMAFGSQDFTTDFSQSSWNSHSRDLDASGSRPL